jgi:hypothetical protein
MDRENRRPQRQGYREQKTTEAGIERTEDDRGRNRENRRRQEQGSREQKMTVAGIERI